MTVETRARRAAAAVRGRTSVQAPPADFAAFLRRAAVARRRRLALVVSLAIAALVGAVIPLSTVYQDNRKITPAERGGRGGESTPTPSPASRVDPQSVGSRSEAGRSADQSSTQRGGSLGITERDAVATGSRIFYSTPEGGAENFTDAVWVMDVDGSDRRRLAVGSQPDPSPDGRRVVFSRDNDACFASGRGDIYHEECREIWVMNDDGSDQRLLVPGRAPDWSPDGRRIAFTRTRTNGDGDVYIMNADGSQVRQLERGETFEGVRPRWSPDGTEIALTTPPEGEDGCSTIYITEVDGPNEQYLPAPGCYTAGPSWSPDGKRIAFFSSRGDITTDIGVYVFNRDGSNLKRLTPTWDGDTPRAAYLPSWSLDGVRIAYALDSDGAQTLYGPAVTYCRNPDADTPLGASDECLPPGPEPASVYVMDADGSNQTGLGQGRYPEFSR